MIFYMLADIGIIGLGVIGGSFTLNLLERGFLCAGYDEDKSKYEYLAHENNSNLQLAETIESLLSQIKKPRKIFLFVPSDTVDHVIKSLKPLLSKNDILIDSGNSHFLETERRISELAKDGINFVGIGISGGIQGARKGASIMFGGDEQTYEILKPFLEAASAKVDGESCQARVGNGAAGHFVKMAHNGIEYALMQSIAEIYAVFKNSSNFTNSEIADIFQDWNNRALNSYLIEISSKVLKRRENSTELIELISDAAEQKGTGKWMVQTALQFGTPIPSIEAAVCMRFISSSEKTRKILVNAIPQQKNPDLNSCSLSLENMEKALLAAFLISYAEGFELIFKGAKHYECNLQKIAATWRGGCIIRSQIVEYIYKAFQRKSDLENLLADPEIASLMMESLPSLKKVCVAAIARDIPVMALSAALNYINAYRTSRLPTNLIQAQRDFFGRHGYRRIDKPGIFSNMDWS
jgi:6-phosphogluconate dehydrogenase